jgi:hypothetical protein
MGLIRKQIGSDSPRHQVEDWFVKYAKHRVMFGVFYYPSRVLFKVNENHSDVLWELMVLCSLGEVNEFVLFDFCNISGVKIICHSIEPQNIAQVMSMTDKHILNLNEVIMYSCEIGLNVSFKIKRFGDGDWRVESDQE